MRTCEHGSITVYQPVYIATSAYYMHTPLPRLVGGFAQAHPNYSTLMYHFPPRLSIFMCSGLQAAMLLFLQEQFSGYEFEARLNFKVHSAVSLLK